MKQASHVADFFIFDTQYNGSIWQEGEGQAITGFHTKTCTKYFWNRYLPSAVYSCIGSRFKPPFVFNRNL